MDLFRDQAGQAGADAALERVKRKINQEISCNNYLS